MYQQSHENKIQRVTMLSSDPRGVHSTEEVHFRVTIKKPTGNTANALPLEIRLS